MFTRTPVVILLLAALFVAACGDDSSDETKTTSTTTTTTTSTATTPAEPECSVADVDIDDADADSKLPAPVRATRERLLDAARACDFTALAAVADENSDGFAFTLGDAAPGDAAEFWRTNDARDRIMERLVRLLNTPHAVSTEGPETYVWPAAHGFPRTDTAWDELRESGAYTDQEVASFERDDMYYGYRIGILPNGEWTYFTAGD